jgi:acyl-CoA dehydrogenase
MLLDTAQRMFADHCDKALLDRAEQGEFPAGLFKLVRENGLLQLAMPASGVTLDDGLAMLRTAGRFAVPLPLAEMILGNRWLGGDQVLISVGPGDETGAWGVPWGRQAEQVIAVSPDGGAWLHRAFDVEPGVNLAGEPRDRIRGGQSDSLSAGEDPYLLMALTRAVLMAGGLEQALTLSLEYVTQREQFGRPIARFQAIQHHMAVMAAEVAAAIRAADAALAGLGGPRAAQEVAAAKIRIGEAVGTVVELAQQVHGAMGYTHEHRLHHTTRRLWAWRDDYGTERFWQERLGRQVSSLGADALWDFLATRD